MRGAVRIEGVRELNATFEALGKSLTRNTLKRTGIKALEAEFVPVAQSLAPDDPQTGGKDLRHSIVAGDKLNPRQKRLARKNESKAFAEVYAGTADPAGVQQEFGNVNHGPQGFMRPAWEQTWRAVLKKVGDSLWGEVRKSVERKAKRDAKRAAKA